MDSVVRNWNQNGRVKDAKRNKVRSGKDDYYDGPVYNKLDKKEKLFKILVIGELATGKTSFIKRYVHQYYTAQYRATIGVDFALKVINWDENTVIRLQLWDIAGQERFGNMTRVYYKDAVGCFIVFDVSKPKSFDAVIKWKHDLDSKVSLPDGSKVPCILLANKVDLPKERPADDPASLDSYCLENDFAGWFYTSPKDDHNIDEAANFLISEILERQKSITHCESSDDEVLTIENLENPPRSKCQTC